MYEDGSPACTPTPYDRSLTIQPLSEHSISGSHMELSITSGLHETAMLQVLHTQIGTARASVTTSTDTATATISVSGQCDLPSVTAFGQTQRQPHQDCPGRGIRRLFRTSHTDTRRRARGSAASTNNK